MLDRLTLGDVYNALMQEPGAARPDPITAGADAPLPGWAVAFILVALMVAGLVVRLWNLDLWLPDTDSILHMGFGKSKSLAATLENSARDTHPPLLYVIYFMLDCAGWLSLESARWVSILPGVLVIPAGYVLAVEVTRNQLSGVLMAVAMTLARIVVLQSQMLRQYTLMLFLVMLAVIFMLRHLRTGSMRHFIGYAVTMFLALASMYAAVFITAATGLIGLATWILRKERLMALSWGAAHVILAFSLWLMIRRLFLRAAGKSGGHTSESMLESIGQLPGRLLTLQQDLLFSGEAALPALVLLLFGAGLLWTVRERSWTSFALILIPIILNIVLALMKFYPLSQHRHGIHLVIPLCLGSACALPLLQSVLPLRAGRAAGTVVIMLWLVNYATSSGLSPDSWRERSWWEFSYRQADVDDALRHLNDLDDVGSVLVTGDQLHAAQSNAWGNLDFGFEYQQRFPVQTCGFKLAIHREGIRDCVSRLAARAFPPTVFIAGRYVPSLQQFDQISRWSSRCLPGSRLRRFGTLIILQVERSVLRRPDTWQCK